MNAVADQYIPLEDSTSSANIDVINRSMNSLYSTKMDLRPQDVIPVKANIYTLGSLNYPFANLFVSGGIKVGTFVSSGTTASQSITGVGFKPRAIILALGVGAADSIMAGFGWATASNQVAILGFRADDGGTVGGLTTNAAAVIRWCGTDGALRGQATLTSLDADGFTLSWSVAESQTITYFAIQ